MPAALAQCGPSPHIAAEEGVSILKPLTVERQQLPIGWRPLFPVDGHPNGIDGVQGPDIQRNLRPS